MFTAFMDDAANIMSFHGDVDVEDTVGYAVELWIFNKQKSGQQVHRDNCISSIIKVLHSLP